MITHRLRDAYWSVERISSEQSDDVERLVNVLTIWTHGAEAERYHIIGQVAHYRYDCWDVINGEFVTVQLE